MLQLTISTTCR